MYVCVCVKRVWASVYLYGVEESLNLMHVYSMYKVVRWQDYGFLKSSTDNISDQSCKIEHIHAKSSQISLECIPVSI